MPGPVDLAIRGGTTDTVGRFVLSGERFQIVADGSRGTGAPGEAAGANHLLAAAFATCALNIFRGAVEPELAAPRQARVSVCLQRGENEGDRFALRIEACIPEADGAEAARLRDLYLGHCSIYAALREAIDITVSVKPADGAEAAPGSASKDPLP